MRDELQDRAVMTMTHQLLSRAFGLGTGSLGLVSFFAFLGSMEPAADTQSLTTVFSLATNDDFLNRVKALARLDLEEDELIPAWWDRLHRYTFRLIDTVLTGTDWIKLQRAAPFLLP